MSQLPEGGGRRFLPARRRDVLPARSEPTFSSPIVDLDGFLNSCGVTPTSLRKLFLAFNECGLRKSLLEEGTDGVVNSVHVWTNEGEARVGDDESVDRALLDVVIDLKHSTTGNRPVQIRQFRLTAGFAGIEKPRVEIVSTTEDHLASGLNLELPVDLVLSQTTPELRNLIWDELRIGMHQAFLPMVDPLYHKRFLENLGSNQFDHDEEGSFLKKPLDNPSKGEKIRRYMKDQKLSPYGLIGIGLLTLAGFSADEAYKVWFVDNAPWIQNMLNRDSLVFMGSTLGASISAGLTPKARAIRKWWIEEGRYL